MTLVARSTAVFLIVGFLSGVMTLSAEASESSFEVVGTGIGIYPRAGTSMAAEHVGDYLNDGDAVSVSCETFGETVDNGYAPSDVWAKLSDGTYLPNAFLLTGVDGRTSGVAECSSTATPPGLGMDAAGGWEPYCGSSDFVDEITVRYWADGAFAISLEIPMSTREALDPHAATVSEWHAIQDCVAGLQGEVADSLWDQLECHQRLALAKKLDGSWATGDTYDLESWRGEFNIYNPINSCGSNVRTDLNHAKEDAVWSGRPDTCLSDAETSSVASRENGCWSAGS